MKNTKIAKTRDVAVLSFASDSTQQGRYGRTGSYVRHSPNCDSV